MLILKIYIIFYPKIKVHSASRPSGGAFGAGAAIGRSFIVPRVKGADMEEDNIPSHPIKFGNLKENEEKSKITLKINSIKLIVLANTNYTHCTPSKQKSSQDKLLKNQISNQRCSTL